MVDLDRDIKLGLEILKGNVIDYNSLKNFSSTYFNTNEYVPESLKLFKTGDNWLTVLASGDQTFYAILNGVKNVTTFDVNCFCYYLFELKKAAILGLSQEEYVKFFPVTAYPIFSTKKDEYFSYLTYLKIKDRLNNDVKKFWDTMFSVGNFQYFNFNLRKSLTVLPNRISDYFSEENYPILKERLSKISIKFYHTSLFDLPKEVQLQKYDTIWCSNIHDYGSMNCKEYIDFIEDDIKPILTDEGICLAYYDLNPHSSKLANDYFIKKNVFVGRQKVAALSLVKKSN